MRRLARMIRESVGGSPKPPDCAASGTGVSHRPSKALRQRPLSAVLAAFAFGGISAAPLPDLPPGTRVESVIDDGSIEGYRVSVTRFRSGLPVEELLAKLRRPSDPGSREDDVERRVGAWRVLSQREGEGFRTVQLRATPDGDTEGLHTRWRAVTRVPRAAFDPASLLPPGARLLRRFSATDGGQRGETLVARSDDSVDRTVEVLHARLRAAGFEGGAPAGSVVSSTAYGVARFYRKSGREIVLTVAPHPGQTGLVLHHSEVSP